LGNAWLEFRTLAGTASSSATPRPEGQIPSRHIQSESKRKSRSLGTMKTGSSENLHKLGNTKDTVSIVARMVL